ncbi:MAG: sugar ABC transporter permease [Chloroflexi bacterium]|nr:sugar ABC transporter permease [Chloroflexota bacterium]
MNTKSSTTVNKQKVRSKRKSSGVGRGAPPWPTLALFLLPAFLLYTVFMIWPLVQSLIFSTFEFSGLSRGAFVGMNNFRELFTRFPLNEQLPRAFLHNVYFFLGTMLIQNTMGLLFAKLLYGARFGKRFFQTVYTMPYLISALVVGYLWSLMLNPLFGPINQTLKAVGLDALARPWLGDPATALPAIILVNAWQWVGFPMLLFSAGLAGIGDDIREAARIDGANAWQMFSRIELPLLTPVIGIVTVLTFIGNFNAFGIVWALGGVGGEPAGSTDVLGLVFYRTAFRGGVDAFGLASALAVLMFIFIFGVSTFTLGRFRRLEENLT